MKYAATALLCLLTTTASAAAPEDGYFAARAAAFARMDKIDANDPSGAGYAAAADKENAALEALLRPLIGPVEVKGFSGPGKLNLDSLVKDVGFGMLDGLAFTSADDKATLIATTAPIFRHWLAEHQNWWDKGDLNPPQTVEAALKSSSFCTQATSTDAAFSLYAELAVTKPSKADFAVAMLAARSQDDTPEAPDEIVAAIVSNGRVLIEDAPVTGKIAGTPACMKIAEVAQSKIQVAEDSYVATKRKNDALAAKLVKLKTDADAAFRACFQGKAKTQKGFSAAQAQAQALIDAMGGN